MIVKIEAVFFIVLKLITDNRDSSVNIPQIFFVVTKDNAVKYFAFICKIYYISKLLEELDLSFSKSKTYSKATHFIEEIIQANICYCKKF